ncbi:MAG: UxaA family hydrolase [Phoenicibacter congonensis]|uniref:UxaA family hydrolase n=1 Tax=Phoenicibacter congonensis TaxID=1944646 RepID=A0AA43RGT5_9ACTN|nr:UxaA family hydrolase [Phoenicibacter congonensis]
MGYKRENGAVGIRNYVLLLPLDAVSCSVCKGVTSLIAGTTTFCHPYGRMQFGEDLDLHFKTLIGCGRNPNVAAVIVVGIEDSWTSKIAEGIEITGKPVAKFSTSGNGDLKTIEAAARKAAEFVSYATSLKREPADASQLFIGLKCGESDTTSGIASNPATGVVADMLAAEGATLVFGETPELTGAENVVAKKFATNELSEEFMQIWQNYFDFISSKGVDLLGSQPNKGNISGGITTIEEKALGNIQKLGTSEIVGILGTCEAPKNGTGKGLYFMDTSSAAANILTAFAAAGAQATLFTTGKGNNVGNVICPTIKICGNSDAVRDSSENIDVDVSGVIDGNQSLEQAADDILASLARVASGQLCAAEILKHDEFAPIRLFLQA